MHNVAPTYSTHLVGKYLASEMGRNPPMLKDSSSGPPPPDVQTVMTPEARKSAEVKLPVLSVLLPVRNEGMNLRIMLRILRAVLDVPHEVLVVYDDPQDTSIAVVRELEPQYPGLRGILNNLGKGVQNAITKGVGESRGKYVLIFAADEIGPVVSMQDMLDLMEEGCDLVSCTRYKYGGRRLGGSFIGGVLSRLANHLFHWLAGSQLSDSTTGIKMFRRDIFQQFQLESRPVGWVVAFEMAIKAQVMGLRLGEVPIVSIDRLYGGRSTFKLLPWVVEYARWFFWGGVRLRRKGTSSAPKVMVRTPRFLEIMR